MAGTPGPTNQIPVSQMRGDLKENQFKKTTANGGDQTYALSIASVMRVDYEKMEVSLRLETGEPFDKLPIPITFPGAGHRHFFGAMPEPGDICVVGFGMQESGSTRTPFVLAWLPPGTTAGYDWITTQPYLPEESGTTPTLANTMEGILDRIRHKLRHMEPGNIVASSSQGADLVLNESALLSNRRGNEIHLRDQDQAIIVRSLQQFHAGAGFRIYGGMVQRDATFLPKQMFSDGTDWASARQRDGEKVPVPESELGDAPKDPGALTPDAVFDSDLKLSAFVSPYEFLKQGSLISPEGTAQGNIASDAIYGGKQFYRVSDTGANAVIDSSADTFTEYRIEVAHTSDGVLPVTEQTDGFDADRLPPASGDDADPLGVSINAPFIEFVLGSVVGNDPFSQKGLAVYGLPLQSSIFSGGVRSPALTTGLGATLGGHAAALLQVKPVVGEGAPTFWTITKDGRVMSSVPGPGKTWSMEMSLGHGLHLGAGTEDGGQSLVADMDGAIIVRALRGRNADNLGVYLGSDGGAVKIYAGGTLQEGGVAARAAPAGLGEGALPALVLESGTNLLIKAANAITLSASKLNLENIAGISLAASTALDFQSGAGISNSSDTYAQSSTGKSTYNFSGPKGGLITNGPLREETFTGTPATGFIGGTADKYTSFYGDRQETLALGNHETQVLVGTQTYKVGTGIITIAAGAPPSPAIGASTSLDLSPGSMTGRSAVVSFTATGGAAALIGTTNVNLTGATVLLTAPAITFASPVAGTHTPPGGIPGGGILTDGCKDGLTGLPFSTSGTLGVLSIRVL